MEKRTCKTNRVSGTGNFDVTVGTMDRNATSVVIIKGKGIVRSSLGEQSEGAFERARDVFEKKVENISETMRMLLPEHIATVEISENNLKTKGYTKVECEAYLKLSKREAFSNISEIFENVSRDVFSVFEKSIEANGMHF